jgi:hypothetical protein
MKNNRNIIYLISLLFIASSCSDRITLPQYVTVETLNALQNGMSKTEVANKMNVAPFDAYHSLESGCELYSYKYLLNNQKIRSENIDKKDGLRGNIDYFEDSKNVYVYFKNNKLVDMITDLGMKYGTDLDDFGNKLEASCSGPISGCTDATALNYNKDATADNGTCMFCPCDQMRNPAYDPVRKCGDICIPIKQEGGDNSDGSGNGNGGDDDCSICDIVKNAGANTTINVSTVAPWVGGSNSSNNSNSNANSKGDKKQSGFDKKMAKLNQSLEKSKAKDAKKGKVSKKTKLLQLAIDKLSKRNN